MKYSTFSKSFDDVFTIPRLLYELSQLKPTPKDSESVKKAVREGKFFDITPKQSFFIPKSDGTYREVALSSTKTKIIQKVLSEELGVVMKFSDRSYAFRKGKSP